MSMSPKLLRPAVGIDWGTVRNGMLAYYNLNGDGFDSSGRNNHLLTYSASTVWPASGSKVGSSYVSFTDISGGIWANLASEPAVDTKLTICGWFRAGTISTTTFLLSNQDGTISLIRDGDGNLYGNINNVDVLVINAGADEQIWNFFCLRRDGNKKSLSVNAGQPTYLNEPTDPHSITDLYLGADPGATYDSELDGGIDAVGIWERHLSDDEVRWLYNGGLGREYTRPFTPLWLPNLAGWWDASDTGTIFDATTGGSTPAADAAIGRWEDKSGNNRHATQATANNRPLRKESALNSLGGIYFDGSNDALTTPSFAVPTAFTWFCVNRSAKYFQPSNARIAEQTSANASGTGIALHYATYTITGLFATTALATTSDTTPSNKLLTFSSDGAATRNLSLYVNGGTAFTGTSTGTPTTPEVLEFSRSRGAFVLSEQTMYEFIYYSRLLSNAERIKVRNYLNSKWAVY